MKCRICPEAKIRRFIDMEEALKLLPAVLAASSSKGMISEKGSVGLKGFRHLSHPS